jgi:hypothetical protein
VILDREGGVDTALTILNYKTSVDGDVGDYSGRLLPGNLAHSERVRDAYAFT